MACHSVATLLFAKSGSISSAKRATVGCHRLRRWNLAELGAGSKSGVISSLHHVAPPSSKVSVAGESQAQNVLIRRQALSGGGWRDLAEMTFRVTSLALVHKGASNSIKHRSRLPERLALC